VTGFDRLSPALQYQVVNELGFASLRPVQELGIDAVLAGDNCVILAPTAGGKTEAAFFPIISSIETQDWHPVSVIYVAPIRALLNNQEPRVGRYAQLVGRRAFKWHGDTTPSQRRTFIHDPSDILLTTPESLEVMMMSPNVPARRLFRTLRAVIVDEIHAFVGDDRGGHLAALLERLSRFCGNDVQRIGLSATVGNPEEILSWLQGSSKRPGRVVAPGGAAVPPKLDLDFVGSEANAAKVIASLHAGKKRLVFVDSRRGVESIGRALREEGIDTYVTHSSLSIGERRQAETAFAEGRDCVVVATSALELGIDIGDLDHVLQVGCPSTVASFLQRMGRSGRREGATPNCTFLAVDDESLVQAAALLRLHATGYVEPIRPHRRAVHLLAHQILALSIQEEGIPESDWWAWVSSAAPFSGIEPADRQELTERMLSEDILMRDGGRLSLGTRGERLYGFRNFAELYAVFSTPDVLTVLWGTQEIGWVEAGFIQGEEIGKLSFTLGAKAWKVTAVDWESAIVRVEPAPESAHARWSGTPRMLHEPLCRAIRDVLTGTEVDAWWSRRTREQIEHVRSEYAFLPAEGLHVETEPAGLRLWTFAGGRANGLLARCLEADLGEKITANNLSIGLKETAGRSEVGLRQALDALRAAGRPTREDALRFAGGCARSRLSKFQACLTDRLESIYLADLVTDADGARSLSGANGAQIARNSP
jgi:ATP-dependent Lhr-like helicase